MAAVHLNPLMMAGASVPSSVGDASVGFTAHNAHNAHNAGHNDVTSAMNTIASSSSSSHDTSIAYSSPSSPPLPADPLPAPKTPPRTESLWKPPVNAGARPVRAMLPVLPVMPVLPVLPSNGSVGSTVGQSVSTLSPFGSQLKVDDFVRMRTLGTGTFARVALVRRRGPRNDEEARQVFALKILRKAAVIKLKQIDHVNHERLILKQVAGHPFITTLQASFSDRDFLYLLLDYVPGGELFSYLRKHRCFNEATARFYAAEIVLVLEYLHEQQNGVAYRDLKPENILLDARGHVKLVDFGFAKRLGRGSDDDHETYTLCGTPEYIAPEVIQNKGHTTAVDWWALGVLIYEFLTGYPPFWHQNPLEIYRQILIKQIVFPSEPPISPVAQDLVRSLCTADQSRRLGNVSGGAAKVKAHPFFASVDWDAVYAQRDPGPIVPPVRFAGDAQCFDIYPEHDAEFEPYTDELYKLYDSCFADF